AERRYGAAGQESSGILARPAELQEATICTLSGQRAQPWCPSRSREWLPAGATPEPCAWHHLSDEGLVTIYPAEYRAWATSVAPVVPGLTAFDKTPAVEKTRPTTHFVTYRATSPPALTIANPAEGTVYSIDPTLRREFQALPLRVIAPQPTS